MSRFGMLQKSKRLGGSPIRRRSAAPSSSVPVMGDLSDGRATPTTPAPEQILDALLLSKAERVKTERAFRAVPTERPESEFATKPATVHLDTRTDDELLASVADVLSPLEPETFEPTNARAEESPKRQVFSDDVRAQAVAMREDDGLTLQEIANMLGASKAAVGKWCKNAKEHSQEAQERVALEQTEELQIKLDASQIEAESLREEVQEKVATENVNASLQLELDDSRIETDSLRAQLVDRDESIEALRLEVTELEARPTSFWDRLAPSRDAKETRVENEKGFILTT